MRLPSFWRGTRGAQGRGAAPVDGRYQRPAARTTAAATGWQGTISASAMRRRFALIALGQGEELMAWHGSPRPMAPILPRCCPSRARSHRSPPSCFAATELRVRAQLPVLDSDPWTAILFPPLFHDRDWEEHLLPHALNAPAFTSARSGSQRTQRQRLGALEAAGVPAPLRGRLRTAVGLIPATRDPATLALSALAQIAEDSRLIEPDRRPQPAPHFETVENRRGFGASRWLPGAATAPVPRRAGSPSHWKTRKLERAKGFEPSTPTLAGCALPLSYARSGGWKPVGSSG